MPAPVAPAEKRTSPLLTVLFWIGVAFAPMAALILLVADGNGPLRFGAVLAILAVVLIGLSIALRGEGGESPGSEHLLDEIEQLRRELRGEIVAAAQRGNQALDQAQRAQESVTALRRRLDVAAAGIAAAAGIPAPAAEEQAGGRARVPAAETYDDAPGRGRYAAQDEAPTGWGQSAGDRRDEEEAVRRPQPAGRYAAERPAGYGAERPAGYGAERPAGYAAERPQAGVYGAPRAAEPEAHPEPAPRQVGVVHHTETVHVTTRHTIVDGADPVAGNRYGGGYAGRRSPAPEERSWGGAEPEERSWAGHREPEEDRAWSADDRSRAAQAGARDDRAWSGPGAARDDRSWPGAPADEHRWAGAAQDDRTGAGAPRDDRGWGAGQGGPRDDRSWAAQGGARDDRSWAGQGDSGDDRSWAGAGEPYAAPEARAWGASEQPGRATVPASDDPDGDYWSELRAGDRWASVRDDEHGREVRVGERRAAVHADGVGTEFRVEDRWASVRRGEPRRDQDRDAEPGWGGGWSEESRPALPAGGVPVPDEWRPPAQRSAQSAGDWRAAEPEPVRYGRPRGEERYGYPPQDDVPRAGGARSADRWR